jgi:hypothetical protein
MLLELDEKLGSCIIKLDYLSQTVSRLAGDSLPPGHAPPVPEATPDATERRTANATAAAAIQLPQPNQPAAAAALAPGQATPVTAPGAPAATAAPQPGKRGSVDISEEAIQKNLDWAERATSTANSRGLQGGGAPNSAASSCAAASSPVPEDPYKHLPEKTANELRRFQVWVAQMQAPACSSSAERVAEAPASIDRGPFPHMPSWAYREVTRLGDPDWVCGLCKGHKYMRDEGHTRHPQHQKYVDVAWELGEEKFIQTYWPPHFGGWYD